MTSISLRPTFLHTASYYYLLAPIETFDLYSTWQQTCNFFARVASPRPHPGVTNVRTETATTQSWQSDRNASMDFLLPAVSCEKSRCDNASHSLRFRNGLTRCFASHQNTWNAFGPLRKVPTIQRSVDCFLCACLAAPATTADGSRRREVRRLRRSSDVIRQTDVHASRRQMVAGWLLPPKTDEARLAFGRVAVIPLFRLF